MRFTVSFAALLCQYARYWRFLPEAQSMKLLSLLSSLSVAVLEARKLKKMDLGGASDPYVKIKLFDAKVNKIRI